VSSQLQATSLAHSGAPSALRALDGLPNESAFALERWLDALAELPFDRWIAVGRACARDMSEYRPHAARALLEAIVADRQIELTAWFIRDMVKTAAYAAAIAASRTSHSVRRDVAVARSAADWAALAIATQTWIPCADREALCAPFDAAMGSAALRLV
jgi:hypothetical protein